MALSSPALEGHRPGWTRQCAQMAKSETHRRNEEGPLIMASREPITLTSAEVRSLAERLRARATSLMLHDKPSQQSDGILAAGALEHLVAELQNLRGEIKRAASSASDMVFHWLAGQSGRTMTYPPAARPVWRHKDPIHLRYYYRLHSALR